MKKSFIFIVGAALAAVLPVSAYGAGLTADQAKAIAAKYVPAGSVLIKTEIDNGNYELEYDQRETRTKYEIAVSQTTDKIVSFDSEQYGHQGGRTVTISEAAAKKAVTGEQKDAEILYAVVDTDDGYNKYKVSFRTETCFGEYEIHSETGDILERNIKIGQMPTAESLTEKQTGSSFIGIEKARQIVLAKAPAGAHVRKLDLDYDDGKAVYEGELRSGSWEYEFKLDAATGTVLEWDEDYDD